MDYVELWATGYLWVLSREVCAEDRSRFLQELRCQARGAGVERRVARRTLELFRIRDPRLDRENRQCGSQSATLRAA